MSGRNGQAGEVFAEPSRGCVLRRRQPKVVVRAPDATPAGLPRVSPERRARVSTLIGLGSREAMPTLFNINDDNKPTRPRLRAASDVAHCEAEEEWTLVSWDDDEDATCFDV